MNTDALKFASPQIDLSGKLIVKVQLGDDIRRIPIHNEDITYDEFLLMMQRLFQGKIKSTDDVLIKYKDEDGDLITIFDSTDLSFAKSLSRYLKITLFVNGKPKPLEHDQVKEIKSELLMMRDRINEMISRLDSFGEEWVSNKNIESREATARRETPSNQEKAASPAKVEHKVMDGKAHAALFDPLPAVKNEADASNAPDTSGDIFANIGKQGSQPSSLTSNQYNQPSSAPSVSSQQNYAPQPQQQQTQQQQQQTTQQQQQQVANSAYPTHYQTQGAFQGANQQTSQSQNQASQYPTQGASQQGYYPDQSSYPPQVPAERQSEIGLPSGQPVASSQYDQNSSMYSSLGYNPPISSYPTAAQPYPQVAQNAYSQGTNQAYAPGQQGKGPQNPYARSMSPRQQYPQPSSSYNYYYQSQGQQPGFPTQ